ncbi:MAG: branched-chain amino acid ABC transporter permease, partial [Halobacterium sp.]
MSDDRLSDVDADRVAVAGAAMVVLALAFAVSPLTATIPGDLTVFVEVGILFAVYGVLVLGLDLQYGHTGLVNFGHVVFFAVGAYTVGIMAAQGSFSGTSLGLPWPLALAAGVVTAGVVGAIVGATSLRLRDDFLAIATLAAAEIFHSVTVNFQGVFGGSTGILSIPQPLAAAAGDYETTLLVTL